MLALSSDSRHFYNLLLFILIIIQFLFILQGNLPRSRIRTPSRQRSSARQTTVTSSLATQNLAKSLGHNKKTGKIKKTTTPRVSISKSKNMNGPSTSHFYTNRTNLSSSTAKLKNLKKLSAVLSLSAAAVASLVYLNSSFSPQDSYWTTIHPHISKFLTSFRSTFNSVYQSSKSS